MGDPVKGYDMSSALKKVESAAKKAGTKALDQLKEKATVKGVAAAVNASDKLKNALGGKVDLLAKVAVAADNVKDKLGGLGGLFSKKTSANDMSAAATAGMSTINAKLADTMFTALPDEEVLATDAYGLKKDTTLNSLVGKLKGFSTGLLEKAGGAKTAGKSLLSGILSDVRNGGKIDAKALTGRIAETLGGKVGILGSMTGALGKTLNEKTGLPTSIFNKIESAVSGQLLGYSSVDVKSARGIFDIVGRVTGDSEIAEYFDVGAEASLLSTVYREALSVGIPDTIDAMHAQAKSKEAAYYALQSNQIVAAQLGEVATLELMADTLGSDRMLADNPRVVSQLLGNYRLPDQTSPDDYPGLLSKLVTALNKIDPHWGQYKRGNTWVTDLSAFVSLSGDARTLLSTDPAYEVAIALAGEYPSQDLIALSKTNYPGLLL